MDVLSSKLQRDKIEIIVPCNDSDLMKNYITDHDNQVVMAMAMPDDIKNILGPNEKVELYIKEKIYHPQMNIDSLIITDQRIIMRHPHALGLKKDYTDYSYSEIASVQLDKGIMRSTIKLTLKHDAKPLELGKLPNSLAEKGYGIIRENVGRFQAPFSTGYANVPDAPKAPK